MKFFILLVILVVCFVNGAPTKPGYKYWIARKVYGAIEYLTGSPVLNNEGAFIKAVANNDVTLYEELVGKVTVNAKDNLALRLACLNGHVEMVNKLLAFPLVDPNAKKGEALYNAAVGNHKEIVEILLNDKRSDNLYNSGAFEAAVQKNHTEIAKMLFETSNFDETNSSVLVDALKNDNTELYSLMISNSAFNPRVEDSFALRYAVRKGDIEMARNVLGRSNPNANKSEALRIAVENSNFNMVELLLSNQFTIANFDDDFCLVKAVNNSRTDIVSLLLKDNDKRKTVWKINVRGKEGIVFRAAIAESNYELLDLLSKHDPEGLSRAVNDESLMRMVIDGHIDTLKRCFPKEKNTKEFLLVAAEKGHKEIVEFLIGESLSGIDEALVVAINYRRKDLARFLFEKGANPSYNNNQALTQAQDNLWSDLVESFLKSRFFPTKFAVRFAFSNGFEFQPEKEKQIEDEIKEADEIKKACVDRNIEILKVLIEEYEPASKLFELCPSMRIFIVDERYSGKNADLKELLPLYDDKLIEYALRKQDISFAKEFIKKHYLNIVLEDDSRDPGDDGGRDFNSDVGSDDDDEDKETAIAATTDVMPTTYAPTTNVPTTNVPTTNVPTTTTTIQTSETSTVLSTVHSTTATTLETTTTVTTVKPTSTESLASSTGVEQKLSDRDNSSNSLATTLMLNALCIVNLVYLFI
jgi:ankyrin repeat protein